MKDRVFLDTNILVYAYDTHDPEKRSLSNQLLEQSLTNDNSVISTQVLGELFTTLTRKIKNPLAAEEAEEILDALSVLYVQEVDKQIVKRAVEIHKRYDLSYWDSQIVAAAERAECETICSEDLAHGQQYYEVTVRNPFLPPFYTISS